MPIYSQIISLLKQKGSIFVDEMMRQALTSHPYSYYQKQNHLGELGDFITAPEISQLFGEIIALWVIDSWYKMGSPPKINLVELGPGCGTLMRDLLNVAQLVPEFYQALRVELVEINPYFIRQQKSNLQQFWMSNTMRHLTQVQHIAEVPSIIIANEFFDALPIKQYIKDKNLWYEVTITSSIEARLQFAQAAINKERQNYLLQKHPNAIDGAIIEESLPARDIIQFISQHIGIYLGAALIIDYGYDIDPSARKAEQYTPTLQAIMNHQYADVLENLGKADLSSHVDFFELKTIAKSTGIEVSDILTQSDFLVSNGILLRRQLLYNKLPPNEAAIISRQVDRLISANKMGGLFKVLCLYS